MTDGADIGRRISGRKEKTMRLIDADAIKGKIDKSIFDADDKEWYLTLLANAPSIDLVRCGECRHRHILCKGKSDDWYCADGQRRENE